MVVKIKSLDQHPAYNRKPRTDIPTARQRAFASLILAGEKPVEAFRKCKKVYSSVKSDSNGAYQFIKHPHVARLIAEGRARLDHKTGLTRERKRQKLQAIVEATTSANRDKIKAIEVDNNMTGDNAPQKHEVFGISELLSLVRKRT